MSYSELSNRIYAMQEKQKLAGQRTWTIILEVERELGKLVEQGKSLDKESKRTVEQCIESLEGLRAYLGEMK